MIRLTGGAIAPSANILLGEEMAVKFSESWEVTTYDHDLEVGTFDWQEEPMIGMVNKETQEKVLRIRTIDQESKMASVDIEYVIGE